MSEILKKDEEVPTSPQTTSRSGEIVTLQQMLVDGYETPRLAEETKPAIEVIPAEEPRDKQKEEKEFKEMQDITLRRASAESGEDSELEEEIVIQETPRSAAPTASPRSILKTSSSNPSTARTVDSEDRGLSPPPLAPLSPPPQTEVLEGLHHAVMINVDDEPKKPNSMMYADAETDSGESDDEAQALPPVAKPEDDKTDLEEETDEEEKSEKENRVTRLSVKSNGQVGMRWTEKDEKMFRPR